MNNSTEDYGLPFSLLDEEPILNFYLGSPSFLFQTDNLRQLMITSVSLSINVFLCSPYIL